MEDIFYQNAQKTQAPDIANFIMMAMSMECCRFFYEPRHTADDFHQMITRLVTEEVSQYSYRNTVVAVAGNRVVGVAVSYDGAQLHILRPAFVTAVQKDLQRDFSNISDETAAGELYLDSFAVLPDYRHQGIGHQLLEATTRKAITLGLPCVGLLVDNNNLIAEKLYLSNGFCFVNEANWGGHPMKHLQKKV